MESDSAVGLSPFRDQPNSGHLDPPIVVVDVGVRFASNDDVLHFWGEVGVIEGQGSGDGEVADDDGEGDDDEADDSSIDYRRDRRHQEVAGHRRQPQQQQM